MIDFPSARITEISRTGFVRVARRRGISTLEIALALPIILLVLFGIFDFGRLLFTHMALQHAVSEGARYAVTGRHENDADNNPLPRVDSIIQKVVQGALPLLELPPGQVTVSSSSGGSGHGGGPGDIVTVSAVHQMSFITPLIGGILAPNGYTLTAASVFKNEPFPSSFTH